MQHSDIAERLAAVRCFLLDMDGTFYLGDRLIPGSLDFLSALHRTGRTARFLTNNSSRSAGKYVEKLTRMGVPEEYRDVISSSHAAGHWCLRHMAGKRAFVLGNEALREELSAMGIEQCEDAGADYLLAGFDTSLNYEKLCVACDIVRAGKPYLATHPDFNCPTEQGFIPDLGSFMALIEASTGRKADRIFGKPHAGIVEESLERTGYPREQLAMVGDRLYTDVATGVQHGITAILVLSGETKQEDLKDSPWQPDLVFQCLADMIPYLQ